MRLFSTVTQRVALCIFASFPGYFSAAVDAKEIKIGVRAHRGIEIGLQKWQPTADFLTSKLPQHRFVLVPFEINSDLNQAVSRGEFDFVLTNPASYVEQHKRYGVSAIATLINKNSRGGYTHYGSVIFTRADRDDINSFQDLKGKSFMGVDEQGFGGWRAAWLELLHSGIDPYRDFSLLSFGGGIQQNVVFAVRDGEVDAGSVRSDLLERMAQNHEIRLENYKVLDSKDESGFSFMHSTRLYPEWPFAKLLHTPQQLAEQVTTALYSISPDSAAATAGKYVGWTKPVDYQPVDDLLKELRVGPYATFRGVSVRRLLQTYWQHVLITLVVFLTALAITTFTIRSNRRLKAVTRSLESEITKRRQVQTELENHQKQLEQTVNERTEALKASNRELESYSYSIAHDLRAPLRSIIGFSQILQEDAATRLAEEERDSLNRIVAAGKHMASLIDDILQLSRISRSPFQRAQVDLSALAKSLVDSQQESYPDQPVQCTIQPDMTAIGDKQLITILLQNLLDNAWKFTRHSPRPIIDIGVKTNEEEPIYFVADNGVGFDMQYADKIFLPFQRLHVEKFEGTGIGLSTVLRVVQRHGGRIWVESAPDEGTTFYFTLSPADAMA